MASKKHPRAKHHRAHNRMRYRAQGHRHHNMLRRSRHHRRRAHNPFTMRSVQGSLVPALIGAGGAIGTDIAMAYAAPYLPALVQTGWGNIAARALMAVGVGYAAGAITNKRTGAEVMAGGLVVVAYSALKQALAPTLGQYVQGLSGLADFGDYRPAQLPYSQEVAGMMGAGMGAYMRTPMGAYMRPRLGAYMNPAAILTQASPVVARQRAFAGFGGLDFQGSEGSMM